MTSISFYSLHFYVDGIVLLYCYFNNGSRVSGDKHMYSACHLEQEVSFKKKICKEALGKYEALIPTWFLKRGHLSCKPITTIS